MQIYTRVIFNATERDAIGRAAVHAPVVFDTDNPEGRILADLANGGVGAAHNTLTVASRAITTLLRTIEPGSDEHNEVMGAFYVVRRALELARPVTDA